MPLFQSDNGITCKKLEKKLPVYLSEFDQSEARMICGGISQSSQRHLQFLFEHTGANSQHPSRLAVGPVYYGTPYLIANKFSVAGRTCD